MQVLPANSASVIVAPVACRFMRDLHALFDQFADCPSLVANQNRANCHYATIVAVLSFRCHRAGTPPIAAIFAFRDHAPPAFVAQITGPHGMPHNTYHLSAGAIALPRRSAVSGDAAVISEITLSTAAPEIGATSRWVRSASARNSLSCANAMKPVRSAASRSVGMPGGAITGRATAFWVR